MIEIIFLFLSVYGISAAPGLPSMDRDYLNLENDAEIILAELPGSQNLNEKALPVSKLYHRQFAALPGSENLSERSQIPRELPGTRNLAEKRIPDFVLRRLAERTSYDERS